jgi:hypothetical protein
LYADEITSNSAVLHWSEVPMADQYVVAFWSTDDLANVGKKRPSTNMYAISEGILEPETTYGFRVKTVCYDEGEMSPYSEIAYFTTLPLRVGEFSQSVFLYPNPTSDQFSIQMNGYEDQQPALIITNAIGQIVVNRQISISGVEHTETIDLGGLPAGIYHVTIIDNTNSLTRTLVVE